MRPSAWERDTETERNNKHEEKQKKHTIMKKYTTPGLKVMSLRIQSILAGSETIPGLDVTDAAKDRDEHLLDGLFD